MHVHGALLCVALSVWHASCGMQVRSVGYSVTWSSFNSSCYGCVENLGCGVCSSAGVIKVKDQHSHGRCGVDARLRTEKVHLHLHGTPVELPEGACTMTARSATGNRCWCNQKHKVHCSSVMNVTTLSEAVQHCPGLKQTVHARHLSSMPTWTLPVCTQITQLVVAM